MKAYLSKKVAELTFFDIFDFENGSTRTTLKAWSGRNWCTRWRSGSWRATGNGGRGVRGIGRSRWLSGEWRGASSDRSRIYRWSRSLDENGFENVANPTRDSLNAFESCESNGISEFTRSDSSCAMIGKGSVERGRFRVGGESDEGRWIDWRGFDENPRTLLELCGLEL